MKKIILSFCFLASLTASAQVKVSLSGTATEGAKTVYIHDNFNFRGTPDSVAVGPDGRWAYSGEVAAGHYVLGVRDDQLTKHQRPDELVFVMADSVPSELNLTAGTVSGSKATVAINGAMRRLFALMQQGPKDEQSEQQALDAMRQAMMDNLDSMLPAVFMPMIGPMLSAGDLKTVLQPTAPYYNLPELSSARERLDLLTGNSVRSIGKMFTDMTMADTEGLEHSLSEYCGKGRYVLIDFWASWCGPCRAEMPNVVACYEKYHDKGLDIIGISFDQNKEAWLKTIDNLRMPWTHLSDLKGWQSVGASTYAIRSIPANILLDKEGKIIDIDLRGAQLGQKLAELFSF